MHWETYYVYPQCGCSISWETMKNVRKTSNRVIFSEFTLPMSTTETETETEKLQLK